MASFKGVGWRELIKSPEYYAQQTRETLAPIISRLAAVANKRLKRMEESGISYSGYEGPDAISGVKKFGAKDKTLGQLRSEYKRLQGFLESPISTITGRKEEYFQAKKRMWEGATEEERQRIGEKPTRKQAYKEYAESKRKKRKTKEYPDEKWIPDETEIFDEVSRLFQVARQEGWLTKSEELHRMRASDQIRDYYQEQVLRAHLYDEDVIDFVRKDLGIDSMREEAPSIGTSTSSFF